MPDEKPLAAFLSPRGVLALALIYGTIFLYAMVLGPGLLEEREAKLASVSFSLASAPAKLEKEKAHSDATVKAPDGHPPKEPASKEPMHIVQKDAALASAESHSLAVQPEAQGAIHAEHTDKRPFAVHRRPFVAMDEAKYILAIAFSDFGLSESASQSAVAELPPEVSFILSPYAAQAQAHEAAARADGHEIWLQIPLETQTSGPGDPGSMALLMGGGLSLNQAHLNAVLSKGKAYAGVALGTDRVFHDALPQMQRLVEGIMAKGLGIWELNPGVDNLKAIATAQQAPFVRTQMAARAGENLPAFYDMIEGAVLAQGRMLAVLPLNPASAALTKAWIKRLEGQGVVLAPVSALAQPQVPAQPQARETQATAPPTQELHP
ncbi:MAG: divergent polysaccharide deacetylase family protein [Alphaproteobacteria bacterium]|nr:divergent polysaccharide deacetylase family protein [Alphaproteobacteria bacterium]